MTISNTAILNPKKDVIEVTIGKTEYTFCIMEPRKEGLLNRLTLEIETDSDYKKLVSGYGFGRVSLYELIREVYKTTVDSIIFSKFEVKDPQYVKKLKADMKALDKLLESKSFKSIAHDDLSLYK